MTSNKVREEPGVKALQSFTNEDYISCIRIYNDLEKIVGPHDKIQHNRAVAEFMMSDMKNIDKFQETVSQLVGQTFPDVELKDIKMPVAFYNYAVLLFHFRYYYQCNVVLEKLISCVKNIKDQNLNHHILLLAMEVSLCRRTADKALDIAQEHGELLKTNSEINGLYERLVARAQLMLTNKTTIALKPDSIEKVFIIAHQQYLSGDCKEAVNTLAQYKTLPFKYDLRSQGEEIWAPINNNLGVIYLSLRKPFLAAKYFHNAVKEHLRIMENPDSDRLLTCRDRPLYVFNLGLAMLAADKPEKALECLVEAARHFPNNPRIWMRLAECCVRRNCGGPAQQFAVRKLGSGPHTRLLVDGTMKGNYSVSGESFAIPSLTLEFGALCLRNAITLLPIQEAPLDPNVPFLQAPPGPPMNWLQRCQLKNSVLVLNSFILLQLQDPLAALANANDLLSQCDVTNSHKALAHVYAAEALINLDRVAEAIEHLNPQMIHEVVSVLPAQLQDMIGVSVWAKAAVCHILRGDLVTARKIVFQISSPRVLPLQIYLEMCTGNIENCHALLRKMRFKS